MKSNKQRREELREEKARKQRKQTVAAKLNPPPIPVGAAPCNPSLLTPNNSYGTPDFVERGYYIDHPFTCAECGEKEVWTATQQKWWYEVAKGDTRSTAVRCRTCRRKRRDHANASRNAQLEGLERKKKNAPNGSLS